MKNVLPIFLGNWKMNFRKVDANLFFEKFNSLNSEIVFKDKVIVGLALPYTLLDFATSYISNHNSQFILGSQNVHWAQSGAHTGEISAAMLEDFLVRFCIIGHSERRNTYGETSKNVALRAKCALSSNLTAIVCVGESEEDFKSKKSKNVVLTQLEDSLAGINNTDLIDRASNDLSSLVIAYEPVWAIGTGLSASPEIAQEMCSTIANFLSEKFSQKIPVLYGGSVDKSNVKNLYKEPNIDGFLVGGASLKPDVFVEMITSCI